MTSITGTSGTATTRRFTPRGILRDRSVQVGLAILVVVGAIWLTAMATSARPPTLDDRVNQVASQLQCPICNGESVADSPSALAGQMRTVIRQQLQSGASEQQVISYFVARYGEGIRQDPPKSGFTLLMWLGPVVMLLAGIFVVTQVARRWWTLAPAMDAADPEADPELEALSADDEQRLRQLLEAELRDDARGGGSAP
jgi:cytochrome c-type biogenesis protein CcmH